MDYIMEEDLENDCISVEAIHAIVERTLLDLYPKSGECYRPVSYTHLDVYKRQD